MTADQLPSGGKHPLMNYKSHIVAALFVLSQYPDKHIPTPYFLM